MLDPLAQRAAIDALEAQRAVYRRFAGEADDQSRAVGPGDAGRAAGGDVTMRAGDELETAVRALRPHLDRVSSEGSPDQKAELQRRVETLSSDADRAQSTIQNLTAQLDAWRLAYGRQVASVGLTPGGSGASRPGGNGSVGIDASARGVDTGTSGSPDTPLADPHAHGSRGYGARGQDAGGRAAPTLLNRLG